MTTWWRVVLQDPVKNCNHYISTFIMPVATNAGRLVIFYEELRFINSHNSLITYSCKVMWNIRFVMSLLQQRHWPPNLTSTHKVTHPIQHCISSTTIPEATKVSNVVSLIKMLPIIKAHEHLNYWLCEITWQIKKIKSDLSQYLLSPNFSGWWLTARKSQPKILITWFYDFSFLLCYLQVWNTNN